MNILKRILDYTSTQFRIDISKLELRPGDIVILKTKRRLSPELLARASEAWKELSLENQCIILDRDFDIASVYRIFPR